MTKLFIEEVAGVPISVGSVSNLEKEMTHATQPVMEEIEVMAQSAERGNADETGFGMKNGQQGWLCDAVRCVVPFVFGKRTGMGIQVVGLF